MITDPSSDDISIPNSERYLNVVRLGDGRYYVQFVKQGAIPRTSYTGQASDVVKQAQRAGNIPIHTRDSDLRRLCRDQLVELI